MSNTDAERIAELERRLARAESAVEALTDKLAAAVMADTTVVAPFRVVNSANRVVFDVVAHGDGAELRIFGPTGEVAAALGLDEHGAGIVSVRDAAGRTAGHLSLEEAGGRLVLFSGAHQGGLAMGVEEQGGWVSMTNADGFYTVTMSGDATGGLLHLHDGRSDADVVRLSATPDGGRLEALRDDETVWSAGADAASGPTVDGTAAPDE